MAITHVLLDIEGTTCPVSFVAETLFPYARRQLGAYLAEHAQDPALQALVTDVLQLWHDDRSPGAQELLRGHEVEVAAPDPSQAAHELEPSQTAPEKESRLRRRALAVQPYLEWLIDHDIKATPLKDLQGRIWQSGYGSGAIVAPLFDDVPEALQRWHRQGLVLAVYSSGSVPAQQLLYGHCQAGDLRPLFQHWFDTHTGPKQAAASYTAIAGAMGCRPEAVLFISDALAELEAAAAAGMSVLFSDRPGNPARDCGPFERIETYSVLCFADDHQRP